MRDLSRCYFVDVETTGLNPDIADILQCAVVDGNGELRHNAFYDSCLPCWPEAFVVNRISKEMVAGLPSFDQRASDVTAVLADAKVICGYNLAFDLDMLEAGGVDLPRCQLVDIMADYSRHIGKYVLRRWSLTAAASHIGLYAVNEHDALDDSLRTLDLASYLMREARK